MKISRNRFLALCWMTSAALTINFVEYTHAMESTSDKQQSEKFSLEEISKRADTFLDALKRDNPDARFKRYKLKRAIQMGDLEIFNIGILPPEIGDLVNLNKLCVIEGSLTKLPPEIGRLVNLEWFSVKDNKFTSLPSEIGNLVKLRVVELEDNEFTEVPPIIWNLLSLKKLNLDKNKLISLPAEIGKLLRLEILCLLNNQLTSLPAEIGKLVKLETLFLGDNQLISLAPQIGELVSLKTLLLFNNQLTSLPSEIGKLVDLTRLLVSNNQLTSLPPEIENLVKLKHLGVMNNQLTRLPSEITNLEELHELALNKNQITELPREIGRCRKLTRLWLNYNHLLELPSTVQNLNNLTTLDLQGNSILLRGDSEHTLGREELQQHFRDRVIFDYLFPTASMLSDTTLGQVEEALDAKLLRINRETLKALRIPDIPGVTIENGKEFMEHFCYLVTNLNFSHEDRSGYLSYELLAGDYASDARNDRNASNTDKIFKYLLPRLTGYFKALYNLSVDEDETRGWQMYEENQPALKKALSFILKSLNDLKDPEQRALLFITFIDGMLHCPTGQKEGIETVALSLLGGKTISRDWRVILSAHLALKKNLHLKTAILAKGAHSAQNVHLISTYEGRLRELLGLSNILGYSERIGVIGEDPFMNNPSNVYQVYFQLLPVPRLVDWAMDKIQTASDRQWQAQLDELVTKEQQAKQAGSMSAAHSALVSQLKSLKAQKSNPEVSAENKLVIATQIGQLETMIQRSASGASGQSSQMRAEEKKELSQKILELRGKIRAAHEFHPISNEMILGYLKEEMGAQLQEGWWKSYFSEDPMTHLGVALTREGVSTLLTKLGYIIDERNKG